MRPKMRDVTMTEFRTRLAEWVRFAEYDGGHVFVVRHGETVAALVPVQDAQLMEEVAAVSMRRLREQQDAALRTWQALRRGTGHED
ncbi:hypothetical protein OCH239_05350 [Roseivivax halodurans JCM 10272]|uniref:Antitoxin n=1 Tax=Roseivivax halodurans JCM 10272 TaxID=1449350 RepID=X7EDQ7_9RHOB|nr:type II toxin-antitoxin system Phd/YefM family antitoxin [Roseivivax halodurans]ETX14067.1 hypothetical protein OCH239_05350 [Roseivivax halodurans JCM 10272]